MHYRSYKSSPIIKFQKKVRFNKKISQYGKRSFNPSIKLSALHVRTMRLHVLPSVKANQILQLSELTVDAINNMEFRRQTHDSHLNIDQIAKQQLISIKEIKSKIRALKKLQETTNNQMGVENENQHFEAVQNDAISRDESMSRLYHDDQQSIGCIDMDSMSLSFEGFDAPTTQSTYPHTQNNILFQEQFDFDNVLFPNH